jgi:hypothetical protein
MGTRSGDLDPGVLVYLTREKKYDADMLEQLVDHRSGLLGISGVGGDMRQLHEAASSSADAHGNFRPSRAGGGNPTTAPKTMLLVSRRAGERWWLIDKGNIIRLTESGSKEL